MQNASTTQPDQLYGYEVDDSNGNKIGDVDGVWVDDATDRAEFVAVKTGWLFGKNHIIPIEQAQIDPSSQMITVPYSQDQVQNGPSYDTNATLSADDEQGIYDYYGLQRSDQTSPTGYAAGTQQTDQTQTTGQNLTGNDEIDVQTVEEELAVGKRQVQTGQVRLRKVVNTEHQEVPVTLEREEVDIERIPAGQLQNAQVGDSAFQEREIDVPLMAEQPVVEKQAQVTGGVRVTKDMETVTQTVGGDVRRSDIEIDEEGGDVQTTPGQNS